MANARRYKYREDRDTTKAILEESTVHVLETGGGCPSLIEQAYQEALEQESKTLKMFAKAQEQVRKAIKLRLDEILESIDPKNMGKTKEVFVRNPDFDRKQPRTDSDEKEERCKGENPFWIKDYEELYNVQKYKETTITTLISMARGENKDIVKELKEAKRKLRQAQKEAREAKDALKDIEDNRSEGVSDEPLVSLGEWGEDGTLQ